MAKKDRKSEDHITIIKGEPLKLTEEESRLLGEFWDCQRNAARSNYIFTDRPRDEDDDT